MLITAKCHRQTIYYFWLSLLFAFKLWQIQNLTVYLVNRITRTIAIQSKYKWIQATLNTVWKYVCVRECILAHIQVFSL